MKFTQKWSAQSVFYQMNHDDIMKHATVMSTLMLGFHTFLELFKPLPLYNGMRHLLRSRMTTFTGPKSGWRISPQRRFKYDVLLQLFLLNPCLIHILFSHRMATSMHKWIIQDFQKQLYKTCGIHSMVLTAYEGKDHNLNIGM